MKFDKRSELFKELLNVATKNEFEDKKNSKKIFYNYFQGKLFEDREVHKSYLGYAKLPTLADKCLIAL